jgi:hypothetical protein
MTDEIKLLVLAAFLLLASGVIVIVLIRLWRKLKKLERDHEALKAQMQRSGDDVAGLCSAAIMVDRRVSDSEMQLNRLLDHLENAQVSQPQSSGEALADDSAQGYALAIERIRDGANLDDLVRNCGLTRDEAVLLMRLHGGR